MKTIIVQKWSNKTKTNKPYWRYCFANDIEANTFDTALSKFEPNQSVEVETVQKGEYTNIVSMKEVSIAELQNSLPNAPIAPTKQYNNDSRQESIMRGQVLNLAAKWVIAQEDCKSSAEFWAKLKKVYEEGMRSEIPSIYN